MNKIGILGGTFNPIHSGHIMLAKKAYEQFKLDSILVMPNRTPAYKDLTNIATAEHRSNMIQLAISPYPFMQYSDLELKRNGNTYTIHTLYELHEQNPNTEYYFIIGGDSLAYLDKWYQYQNILRETVILCARRGSDDYETLKQYRENLIQSVPEARIEFLKTEKIDISSTTLRLLLKEHKDVSEWMSNDVVEYIYQNHLYET